MHLRIGVASGWVVMVFGAMLLGTVASAQVCAPGGVDDGFDPGCCVTPTPIIPTLPTFIELDATYAGIENCAPFNQRSAKVSLVPISYSQCDYRASSIGVTFPPGTEYIAGELYMKYARTWVDNTSGAQIWRFLVNGDLTSGGGGATGCAASPLPPCALNPNNPLGAGLVHWDGHVDYALSTQAQWSFSLSLNHLPGLYTHDSGITTCAALTPAGGFDHRYESYHLVYPQSFVFCNNAPNNFPPSTGAIVSDAVRQSIINVPNYSCKSEIHLNPTGALSTFNTLSCPFAGVCNLQCATLGQCWNEQQLIASSCAVSGPSMSIYSYAVPSSPPNPPNPLPPTTGFASYTIGQWALPAYPWRATLTLYLGTIVATPDPCGESMNSVHLVNGVGTDWGEFYPQDLFNSGFCTCGSACTSYVCIDLCNVLLQSNGFLPGYGCLAGSDLVLNINLP